MKIVKKPPRKVLFPHQEPVVKWSIPRENCAYIIEMRLGKTLCSIRTIQKWYDSWSILVVAPLTVLGAWEMELDQEGELYASPSHYKHLNRERRLDHIAAIFEEAQLTETRRWVLINYDLLRSIPEITHLPNLDVAVLDESVKIANWQTSISEVCRNGFRFCKHRMILSGLIAPESEAQLFNQFCFLQGHFMGHTEFYKWKQNYFFQDFSDNKFKPRKWYKQKIKDYLYENCYVLTRKEVNLGSEKIYEKRTVEMPPTLAKIYKNAQDKFAAECEDGTLKETTWAMVLETWLGRLAGGFDPDGNLISSHKIDELMDLLTGELGQEQVVVWCRFNAEIREISQRLLKAAVPFGTIVGANTPQERKDALQRLRDGFLRVLVAQVACAQYGVDCSTSDTAIYFSNSYSCNTRAQSEDRIIHPAKTSPCLYIDLCSKGTVDETVAEVLVNKKRNAKMLTERLKASLGLHFKEKDG